MQDVLWAFTQHVESENVMKGCPEQQELRIKLKCNISFEKFSFTYSARENANTKKETDQDTFTLKVRSD